MPKKTTDYSKGLIYKIVCMDLSIKDNYVGSTTNFTVRKNSHKSACNNPYSDNHNLKVYQMIRANGGWENWDMILIQYFPCKTELELLAREHYWYEKLNSNMKKNIPIRTPDEMKKRKDFTYQFNNKSACRAAQQNNRPARPVGLH